MSVALGDNNGESTEEAYEQSRLYSVQVTLFPALVSSREDEKVHVRCSEGEPGHKDRMSVQSYQLY